MLRVIFWIVAVIVVFLAYVFGRISSQFFADRQKSSGRVSTQQLGEAALTFLLLKLYNDKFPKLPDLTYDRYDGEQLPVPSGYNLANACLTYIQHGGEKSRAIEKFLDNHLRSFGDVETFLQRADASLRTNIGTQ